jgi:hypothetical protein
MSAKSDITGCCCTICIFLGGLEASAPPPLRQRCLAKGTMCRSSAYAHPRSLSPRPCRCRQWRGVAPRAGRKVYRFHLEALAPAPAYREHAEGHDGEEQQSANCGEYAHHGRSIFEERLRFRGCKLRFGSQKHVVWAWW